MCCILGVSISRSPGGSLVSTNSYRYPLLSTLTLTCTAITRDNLPYTMTSYDWNTTGCYTNPSYNGGNPGCFPNGQTTRDVIGHHLTAEDAGVITCSATSEGWTFTSNSLTLQISGDSYVANKYT